jgi:chromosome partitioning protein
MVSLKGGTGKTTLATHMAEGLQAHLVDTDPQGDAFDWAKRSGIVTTSQPHDWKEALDVVNTARAHGPVVIDCPPGEGPTIRAALSVATVAVVPAKGTRQDLRAVGRVMELVDEVRMNGNPSLRVGLIMNEARSVTSMAEVAENAMKKVQGAHYLGHLGLRQAFVEAFASGKVVHAGPARRETETLMENLHRLIRRKKP